MNNYQICRDLLSPTAMSSLFKGRRDVMRFDVNSNILPLGDQAVFGLDGLCSRRLL